MTTTPAMLGDSVQHRSVSQGADIAVLATGGTIDKIYNLAGELEIGPASLASSKSDCASPRSMLLLYNPHWL